MPSTSENSPGVSGSSDAVSADIATDIHETILNNNEENNRDDDELLPIETPQQNSFQPQSNTTHSGPELSGNQAKVFMFQHNILYIESIHGPQGQFVIEQNTNSVVLVMQNCHIQNTDTISYYQNERVVEAKIQLEIVYTEPLNEPPSQFEINQNLHSIVIMHAGLIQMVQNVKYEEIARWEADSNQEITHPNNYIETDHESLEYMPHTDRQCGLEQKVIEIIHKLGHCRDHKEVPLKGKCSRHNCDVINSVFFYFAFRIPHWEQTERSKNLVKIYRVKNILRY